MPSPLQEQIAKVQKKLAELKAKAAGTKEKKPQRGTQGFAEKPSKPATRKAQNVRTTKAPPLKGMTKTKKAVPKEPDLQPPTKPGKKPKPVKKEREEEEKKKKLSLKDSALGKYSKRTFELINEK